ncbi:PREDICTED: uncharacterized protein LOC109463918 isoform X1 [Branchiostoma belcheri]|uniref:Uncharacterized protein LOC109463918 isoform X1 n=1 Tax=Branchiostoma belcheri TaxID=7741 RepID=A0A6P4YC58_BRABE|nr:PREDICTED: uncharacterized protein LOC109463918 isoform X1 [Branchiostoma belcheri]
MEDGGGRGREKSNKRPHSPDDDDVVLVSFKKEKKNPEPLTGSGTEDDVVIVEETQEGTSANDGNPLGKEDFVVTYFKPSDTIKYPHAREDCMVHKFQSGTSVSNATFCDSCYCYVCDIPAKECQQWTQDKHCNAYSKDNSWKLKRNKTIAANSREKARRAFASHPSLRSCLSQEEREGEGMSSIHDSSLDEILNRIESTYQTYKSDDYEAEDPNDCYCHCHDRWGYQDYGPCYACENYHYECEAALYHDYDPVRRALSSAVTAARTHWQNKKPVEALITLEETMRSLCLHQPCDTTRNSYAYGDSSDGGLVTSKRAVLQSIEELLVDMFIDRSGIVPSSLREKALKNIKRIFELAPRDSGNIRPDIALGLKTWDDQDLLAVLNGSYNSAGGQGQQTATGSSWRGNSTAEVIVVDAVNSRHSSFTEDYLVVNKRLQVLEKEKRWQEAANYIQRVNIRCNQFGNGSLLKNKLLTYLAHLGNWKEVRSELLKSESPSNHANRPRLARLDPTDFLTIMKCFTTGQDIEMLAASSATAPAPSLDVNIDEVFRIYLYAMTMEQSNSLKYNEKCVSWFIAWTCQEGLQEIFLEEFQRCVKLTKSLIGTSCNRVTKLEQNPQLNNKVGRAVMATCWLSDNWSSRNYLPPNEISTVMDGYKNNLWLAVFLLFRLCEVLKASFSHSLSATCHHVANWISTHEGFDLQRGSTGKIVFGKVLSQLPLAKEVLDNFLAAVLSGNKTPKEKERTVLRVKTAVSKLANSRELIGKVLVYMAKVGKCTEVQEELMKEKQDAKFRPLKAVAQIGEQDFLDIMKALVETGGKLWGVDQGTQYTENKIFEICIQGLAWNEKVQQSLSFITWFLGLVCAEKMDKPCDSQMKPFEDIAKIMKASPAVKMTLRKECKAVVACIHSLPGLKSKGSSSRFMRTVLDILKQNRWLLTYVLNRPDGPRGRDVADWISENGTEILNQLTDDATKSLLSSMQKDVAFSILKGLVKSSGNRSLEVKRRIVQFSECLLNQLKKHERMSNEILAYIIATVDPIAKTVDGPLAKTFVQQLYQTNFEFCPTMKSLEELKKVCSPEEWLRKRDSCLVYYINDITAVPTCLTCIDLLMKSGSDYITQLLSRPVATQICSSKGDDSFSPASSDVINKIAAVLKELPSAGATLFLQKAQSWLVAESWKGLFCSGRSCKNKVQPSMDVLWKVIAQISPQDLVLILKDAMEGVQRRLNIISVNQLLRSAYVSWLLRVKDAFQLAGQLYQFGQILNTSIRLLRRKQQLTREVTTSGLLHNLPDKENPNAKKKGNGASPNLSNALQTLNISNTGKNSNDAVTMLMKELIADKSCPVADTHGAKHQPTSVSADATPMDWADNGSGNSVKKVSKPVCSSSSVQAAGKSEKKSGYQTRSKDKSNAQTRCKDKSKTQAQSKDKSNAKTSSPPCTKAPATVSNSSTMAASVEPTKAPGNASPGGDQNSGSTELVNIVSKILELTKSTGVDGAFQLIIGRMTGKVASSSPLAEEIISKLLKLKGPINLKIGNNRLVINSQLASSTPVIPNLPPPQPAQTMPAPRRETTVPYADPTTASISQSAPQHRYGTTAGPNLAPRPILPLHVALSTSTRSITTHVPGAMPPVSGCVAMPGTAIVPAQPSTLLTPVTSTVSHPSSSTATPKTGLSIANSNSMVDTAVKPSTQALSTTFAADILRQIISDIDADKGTAPRMVRKPGEMPTSKMSASGNLTSTAPIEAATEEPMEIE